MNKKNKMMLLLAACGGFPTALGAHTTQVPGFHMHLCSADEAACVSWLLEQLVVPSGAWMVSGVVGMLVLAGLLARHYRVTNHVASARPPMASKHRSA